MLFTSDQKRTVASPLSDKPVEDNTVREQLKRVLNSPPFKSSKRLSSFLSYVVEEALNGNGSSLKERTIGIKVFGKDPDYETNADPVVRVSAGEVRKRIAQYYHEPGRESELRIDLPVGSYIPTFRRPEIAAPVPVTPRKRWPIFSSLGASISAVAVLWLFIGAKGPGDAYSQFWQPVVDSPGEVLIYVGERQHGDLMVFEDALALADMVGALQGKGKTYRIMRGAAMTPENMRQGPALLIGAFTNSPALRLTGELRFTFANEGDTPNGYPYIKDRQDPDRRQWSMKGRVPGAPYTDYAIVSRVTDPTTGRKAIVCGGIGKHGTAAAAEFLATPEQLRSLTKLAPRDWRNSNMQAVLAVDVQKGKRSNTRVVSTYFW